MQAICLGMSDAFSSDMTNEIKTNEIKIALGAFAAQYKPCAGLNGPAFVAQYRINAAAEDALCAALRAAAMSEGEILAVVHAAMSAANRPRPKASAAAAAARQLCCPDCGDDRYTGSQCYECGSSV